MAIQSLTIKDGTGSLKYLAVESSSYGFIPVHQITSSASSPIYITASSANPLPVTGTIAVDVTVGDIINVTASAAAPVFITGTVTNNIALATSYSPSTYTSNILPIQIIGSSSNKASVDSSGRLFVTGALTVNTASSTVTVGNSVLNVTSSLSSPVYAYAYSPPVTTVAASSVTSFSWTTVASGTFNIASSSATRRGLTVFNPGPYNLYIALSTIGGATHGFTLTNTASAPSQYSFIVYPSGTYTADPTTVGVYHGGYFVSSSVNPPGIFISAIS